MENETFICENISLNEKGNLCFAGVDTVTLAQKYGTPLYLMDEDRIRERCRTYRTAMREAFGDKGVTIYASKAASYKKIYEIMKQEDISVDVVSSGEIRTALSAGFPTDKIYFHSNNKTDFDIAYAIDNNIGFFVVDNEEELLAIDKIASEKNKYQKILLRLTPGIDPHTYAAVCTGQVDSKFGSAIETGQAEEITRLALSLKNICLCGFHCHIGSQLFDSDVFFKAADVMLQFIYEMQHKLSFKTQQLSLGGGYGVRYIKTDPTIDIKANIIEVGKYVKEKAMKLNIDMPIISVEPGRSIVADAGMTLYTVGTVKRIPDYKNYVSVDGGMSDNPRFALYGAAYTILPANKMLEARDMTASVVGRCCESGDILAENTCLPESIKRGDILACLTTGAYHYSMASNYNRIPRPPIVMLSDKESYIAVKRETIDDIISLDI